MKKVDQDVERGSWRSSVFTVEKKKVECVAGGLGGQLLANSFADKFSAKQERKSTEERIRQPARLVCFVLMV